METKKKTRAATGKETTTETNGNETKHGKGNRNVAETTQRNQDGAGNKERARNGNGRNKKQTRNRKLKRNRVERFIRKGNRNVDGNKKQMQPETGKRKQKSESAKDDGHKRCGH